MEIQVWISEEILFTEEGAWPSFAQACLPRKAKEKLGGAKARACLSMSRRLA